jgi:hydrogenase expression/formation protein HypD
MKYVDEFRDPQKAQAVLHTIQALGMQCYTDRPIKIMEICGGHTHSIFKYGLEALLPETIELVHGPGCPVCIMPKGRLDDAIALAEFPNVIFTTFGDAMRVPGSKYSLLQARAKGADIRMVYSPLDALQIAKDNPKRDIIFFAIGFETTAPSTALTVLQAEAEGIQNFNLFCNHVLVVPALEALLTNPDSGYQHQAEQTGMGQWDSSSTVPYKMATPNLQLDGFIGPGHVSTVIGTRPYQVIAERYHKPLVVSGFEPLDILQAIWLVLRQLAEGRCEVENQYTRVVNENGNAVALDAINRVFEVRDRFEWRGLGTIPNSGLKMRADYARFDAEVKFPIPGCQVADHKACQCGEILKGVLKPWQCKVFGTACTPEHPIGACMVSSEGACAAYYKYGRLPRAGQEPMPKTSKVVV